MEASPLLTVNGYNLIYGMPQSKKKKMYLKVVWRDEKCVPLGHI